VIGTISKVFQFTTPRQDLGWSSLQDGGIVCADDLATGEKFTTVIQASRLKKYQFVLHEYFIDQLIFSVGDRVTFDVIENDGFPVAVNVQFIGEAPSAAVCRARLANYDTTRNNFESTYGWRETR
jgi:hypothetical protein